MVAVVGWLISHGLALRAQRKNFLDQIANSARLQIANAMTRYEGWLLDVNSAIRDLEGYVRSEIAKSQSPIQKLEEVRAVLFGRDDAEQAWGWLLEDYEILFPETGACRKDLLQRQMALGSSLFNFHLEMYSLIGKSQKEMESIFHKAVDTYQPQRNCMYQLGLIEDVKVYLQNRVLGQITGNKVPLRRPTDSAIPRIVTGSDGQLEIFEGSDQKTGSRAPEEDST